MLSDLEIKKIISEKNIDTVYLQFTDICGAIKNITISANKIEKILNNKITIDGSALNSKRENETKDIVLYPDKETFLVFPFEHTKFKKSARFICDIHNIDGSVHEGCTRSNLKKIIENSKKNELKMQIGAEIEFFLFKKNTKLSNLKLEKVGYYGTDTNEYVDETLFELITTLENMGFSTEAIHHEGSPFQYEVDIKYDDILKTADNIVTFKIITKIIADYYGFKASFMPKPLYEQNGSGLHLNISLLNNNQNIFWDKSKENQLSENALYSIGAILKNIKEITAILNPTVNSYKRLVKDYEAPIYIAWSDNTRSALLRVPLKRGKATRLELRSPDTATNPYLAFAVILKTCLDGIRNKIEPPKPIEKNLFQLSDNEIKQRKIKSLPRNMFTALKEFEKSHIAKVALGEYIFYEFLYSKKNEWNDYRKQVTDWELEKYLDI